MQKITKIYGKKSLLIRSGLSLAVIIIFVCLFYFGGGMLFFGNQVVNYKDRPFEIQFIDVGLGDATLMRFPDDKVMLVDCGPSNAADNLVSHLSKLFQDERIDAIDYLVLTHQDADHVAGAIQVLETFQVNAVYRPKVLCAYEVENFGNPSGYKVSTTATYNHVITAVYQEPNCEIFYNEKGIALYDLNYSVEFLSPGKDSYSASNDYSAILMVTYNHAKFLLTGDAENISEKEVISGYGSYLKADVLKVGHHGSSTSSSAEFLNYVKPIYAVISVAAENRYDFPKADTLERLAAVNATVYSTAEIGNIVLSVNDDGQVTTPKVKESPIFDVPMLICFSLFTLLMIWGIRANGKKMNP